MHSVLKGFENLKLFKNVELTGKDENDSIWVRHMRRVANENDERDRGKIPAPLIGQK